MTIVSAISLIVGMILAIFAFAQSLDPGASALAGGTNGVATGALIGYLMTIPAGCVTGAAVSVAVGGGVGVTAGAAKTPAHAPPTPPPPLNYR